MVNLILLFALSIRLISLNQSFWLDEAIQAYWSSQGLNKLPILNDFHPPFFYYLTHYYQLLGFNNEWLLRLIPLIFGVLSIYMTYKLAEKLFDKNVGLLASFLLAISSYHIYYSQEYRMYSLLLLMTISSWYFLQKNKFALWTAISIAAIYTNYFFALVILSQLIWVNLHDKKIVQKFSSYLAVVILFFSFWIPTFLIQLQNAQKLLFQFPRWGDVSGTSFIKFPGLLFAKFSVGMVSIENKYLYGIIVAFVIITFSIACFDLIKKHIKNSSLVLYYFFIPFVVAMISGLFTRANGPWRLIFILPAFYIILASYFCTNFKKAYVKLLLIVFITINLFFSSQYLFVEKNQRENWRQAVEYSDIFLQQGAVGINTFQEPFTPILWYSKYPKKYYPIQKIDTVITHKQVVYYSYLFEIFDTNKSIENTLLKNNFKVTIEKDFKGVGIVKLYEK